ncbi:serine/threonine-protein kinase [Roseimaritima ulvae]|uniref:Serine/threonine-protein kinase StkP n=1 Tax=Roseimaritima ulvae TaxID=980254 RepID=A0A5B9R0R2_9BACT|nr:serine/threonine-protein kinase [Roseimaritima ulvae]QEG43830.1 Serine/threonine-protein kinase StkP [Roseimaritima ulvae]
MNDREQPPQADDQVTAAFPAGDLRPQETADTSVDLDQTLTTGPLAAATDPLRIGRYTVVQCLGKGGQGAVYRAVHPRLPLELAIKISAHTVDAAAHQALQDEAQILCELEHPHIARVRDLDFDSGRPFLVLDYIRGRSLDELLTSGQPSREQLVQWLASVASAIDYAHRRGILHLDLKPGNIVIDEKDTAKVIDFGMARMRGAWSDSSLEADGISGTLSYMSPEQASGRAQKIGSRSDVFALGAILYRILTGQPPFRGSSVSETLASVRECRFDADRLEALEAPRYLIEACRQAMQPDPANRFASAKAFAEAVAPAVPAPAPRRTSLSFSFLGITITLAVSCLLLMAFSVDWWSSPVDVAAVHESPSELSLTDPPPTDSLQTDVASAVMALPVEQTEPVDVAMVPMNDPRHLSPAVDPANDILRSVRTKEIGDDSRRFLNVSGEEYLALRDLLRQTIGIDGSRINLQTDLKRFLDKPAADSWSKIQQQASDDRDKLSGLIAELEQLQSSFVVDEMESYRQLTTDLGRKLRLYDQLIELDAETAVQDLPAVRKIADEFTELIQQIRQHEASLQKYLQTNRPANLPSLP